MNATSLMSKRPLQAFLAATLLALGGSAFAQEPGKIAYVENFEIWLMEADGTGKTALGLAGTDYSANDVQLSPDGGWVAFTGIDYGLNQSGLFVMRAEAYDETENRPSNVSMIASAFKRVSWHPGGQWLAYVGNDNKVYLLKVLDHDGEPDVGTEETITAASSPVWCSDVTFAPDGRNLLVCQFEADLAFIEVFDANGARTTNEIGTPLPGITSQVEGRATWASFSADGKQIVFQSIKQYTGTLPGSDPPVNGFINEIAIATLTIRDNAGTLTPEHHTSNPRQYLSKPFYYIDPPLFVDKTPSWSKDGSKIVFVDYVDGPPSGYKRIVSLDANAPENDTTNPRVVLAAGDELTDIDSPSFAHPGPGLGGSTANPAAIPPNLISWWPGENTAWDVVGIGEGSMKNSANEGSYDVGKVGRAVLFDGIDDHIQGRSGGMSLVQNFSIEVWVKPLSHSAEQTIIAKGDVGDDDVSYSLLLRDGEPFFRSSMGGVEHEFGANDPNYQGDTTLPVNQWSHLALVSGESFYRMYLNGEIIGGSDPTARPTTSGPLTIGAFVDDTHPTESPGSPFNGLIDELSLYNRKLSQTEIGLIYQAGKQGKARQDPARDFSATANPNLPWRYGWIDGAGSPIPSNLTAGDTNIGGLYPPPAVLDTDDITYVYGDELGAHLLFNRSKTDRATFAGGGDMTTTTIDIAPRQLALHPSPGGDLDYSVLQWVVPENGRYALSGTFTGVEDSPTSTEVFLYHGDTELFTDEVAAYLGDGISTTKAIDLNANDTVTWIVGGGVSTGFDYTGLVASAVKLDDFQPFARPEFNRNGPFGFKPPLMNGKTVRFEGRNSDHTHHPSMSAKIQYSATPGIPGSWVDLPGGTMTFSSSTSQTAFLTISSLPVGTFAFRIVTTVPGLGSTQSAPSDLFTVLAASTRHEVELDVSSASDPTGVATHRGDTLTYRVRFRNSGGLPAPTTDQVQVMVRIPDGTTATATGSTPGYEIVHSGGNTFAMWTLTKPLLPVDPEPAFTVPVASSDMILSDLHNLEVGDLVTLDSDDTLPSPLDESTTYEVSSVTTNQFQLRLPGTTSVIDIINSGTGTHHFERLWQSRILKLAVADPTAAQETSVDDLDFGDILTTFARITDRFHGLTGIEGSDAEETAVINPLSLTAAPPVVDSSPLKQGGTLSVEFTVRNEASYAMDNAFLRVQAPEGLTIRGGVFASGVQQPTPQLTEDQIGSQLLIFETGPLAPGAERVCRANFRVQYDLDLDALPLFDFDPSPSVIDNRPAIVYSQATASTGRPSVTTYVNQPYKKKVRKVIRRPGKKPIIRFVPMTKYRLVPVTYVRNGIEANLEEEFGLEVQEGPRFPHPIFNYRIQRPYLEVSMSQEAAGTLPGTDTAVITQNSELIAGSDPVRRTNQIRYKVTYRNTGDADAEFLRVLVPIPEESTYVDGSVRYEATVDGLEAPSEPRRVGNALIFNLAYLDGFATPPPNDGWERSISFLVQLKPNIPLGTVLNQPGASVTSRDLDMPAQVRHEMEAKVVLPARMEYVKDKKTLTDGDGNIVEIHHQLLYQNTGETTANDVEIRYEIPEGFLLVSADFLDADGDRILKSNSIILPTSPSREIVFPVGSVNRQHFDLNGNLVSGSGWARVRLAKDPSNPAPQPPVGEDGYRQDGHFTWSDSTTPQNSEVESLVAESQDPNSAVVPTTVAPANVFIGVRGPKYVAPSTPSQPTEITYQVTWGSAIHRTPGLGGVIFPIPAGTTYVSHTPAEGLHGQGAGHGGTHNLADQIAGTPYEHVAWAHSLSAGSKAEFATVTVRVNEGFVQPIVCSGVYISGDQAGIREALPGMTIVNTYPSLRELAYAEMFSDEAADRAVLQIGPNKIHEKLKLITEGASWFALGGADAFVVKDLGTWIINIGDNKIVAGGGGNIVAGGGGNIVAGGGGNIVAGGGGNIVAGGGGNIEIRMPDGNLITATSLFADIRSIVAGGGGNIVAGGGLNLVRHVVANDGAGLRPADLAARGLVGLDGASLIGLDGASIIGEIDIDPASGKMSLLDPQDFAPPAQLENFASMFTNGVDGLTLTLAQDTVESGLVIDGEAMNMQSLSAMMKPDGSAFGTSGVKPPDGGSMLTNQAAIIAEHGSGVLSHNGNALRVSSGAGVLSHNGNAFKVGNGIVAGGGGN